MGWDFQSAQTYCQGKSGAHLYSFLRGIHGALEVPLKIAFVFVEEASGMRLVTHLELLPDEELFCADKVSMS